MFAIFLVDVVKNQCNQFVIVQQSLEMKLQLPQYGSLQYKWQREIISHPPYLMAATHTGLVCCCAGDAGASASQLRGGGGASAAANGGERESAPEGDDTATAL